MIGTASLEQMGEAKYEIELVVSGTGTRVSAVQVSVNPIMLLWGGGRSDRESEEGEKKTEHARGSGLYCLLRWRRWRRLSNLPTSCHTCLAPPKGPFCHDWCSGTALSPCVFHVSLYGRFGRVRIYGDGTDVKRSVARGAECRVGWAATLSWTRVAAPACLLGGAVDTDYRETADLGLR